jgi:hypothetical protein
MEYSLVHNRTTVDKGGVLSLQQVTLAVTEERGVVPRQVPHQRDISMAVRPGSAQDDVVVQADKIAADGIDPEEKPALWAGRLDTG